jgi:WD40 repeat protein
VALAFSPDAKWLVASSGVWNNARQAHVGCEVGVWEVATGKVRLTARGHKKPARALAFSPDSRRFAAALSEGLTLWDVARGVESWRTQEDSGRTDQLLFSPDGQTLATAGRGRALKLRAASSGELLRTLGSSRWEADACCLAFSPDGKRLASGSTIATVTLWDAVTGQACLTLADPRGELAELSFSRDGERLVGAYGRWVEDITADGAVQVWRAPAAAP